MAREYTRRHVLAGLGTVGAGFGGSLALFTGQSRAYTSYTHVSRQGQESTPTGRSGSEQHGLRVAWWESYNGRVLETQGDRSETSASDALDSETVPRFVPEATGPIVSVGNVLPGDEGTVGIGVEADVPGDNELGVWFRTVFESDEENGVNEPESAVDDSPNDGEMDEKTRVTVWENSGLSGIGANDGEIVPVVESVVAEGTVREVFDESDLADGIELDCLGSGETTYVALRWELPASAGNVVQSDSVTFGLEFQAALCDAGNPFGGSGGESEEDEVGDGGEDGE